MEHKKVYTSMRRIALLLLTLASGIALFFLVRDSLLLHRQGIFRYPPPYGAPAPKEIPLDDLKPWMTFRYLNRQFHIPDSYFKDRLSITDPAYPDIAIGKFARDSGLDPRALDQHIRQLIQQYTGATSTPASL